MLIGVQSVLLSCSTLYSCRILDPCTCVRSKLAGISTLVRGVFAWSYSLVENGGLPVGKNLNLNDLSKQPNQIEF